MAINQYSAWVNEDFCPRSYIALESLRHGTFFQRQKQKKILLLWYLNEVCNGKYILQFRFFLMIREAFDLR